MEMERMNSMFSAVEKLSIALNKVKPRAPTQYIAEQPVPVQYIADPEYYNMQQRYQRRNYRTQQNYRGRQSWKTTKGQYSHNNSTKQIHRVLDCWNCGKTGHFQNQCRQSHQIKFNR